MYAEAIELPRCNKMIDAISGLGFDTRKIYGPEGRPKTLTPHERRRFTHGYFQLRSLLSLNEEQAHRRLQSYTNLRHLYYLYESCLLPPGIDAKAPLDRAEWRRVESLPSRKRLRQAVWEQIDLLYQRAHGVEAPDDVWDFAHEDGYRGFVALWDHWQEYLKQTICGRRPVALGQVAPYDKTDLWVSEEE